MPVEGTMSAARQTLAPVTTAWTSTLVALVTAASVACGSERAPHVLLSETAPDGGHIALVRLVPCDSGWCESLWLGTNPDSATRVVVLPRGEEHCDDIAWSRDGKRVAFLINGYQLRLYDTQSHAPAGLVDLVAADARPPSRVARGITFSENGAAITFDDCPRDRSGCKPGMLGLR